MDKVFELKFIKANSHYIKVVAFAVIGAVIGGALVAIIQPQVSIAPSTLVPSEEMVVQSETKVSKPVRLKIPAVEIDTSFEGSLGLNADQTVEVPDSYEEVGWYEYGPRPGELGPAVVLGHVDSYEGPAVFFRLGQTTIGDIVEIEREDGSVAKFEITEITRREQSDFPTEAVYGDIDHAGLRLITCTGTFNRGQQLYSHNLIVFAKLIEDIPLQIEN